MITDTGQEQSQRGRGRGQSRGQGRGQPKGGQGGGQDNVNNTQKKGKKNKKEPWKWETLKPTNLPPTANFIGNIPGPEGIAVGLVDPLACFHMYETILEQSNLYATQQRTLKQHSLPWNPITKVELMAYMGINIAMGIVSLPAIKNYWMKDALLWPSMVLASDESRSFLGNSQVLSCCQQY